MSLNSELLAARRRPCVCTAHAVLAWCPHFSETYYQCQTQQQLMLVILSRSIQYSPSFSSPLSNAVLHGLVPGVYWREETEHLFTTARTPAAPRKGRFHYCAVKKKLFLQLISAYFRSVIYSYKQTPAAKIFSFQIFISNTEQMFFVVQFIQNLFAMCHPVLP